MIIETEEDYFAALELVERMMELILLSGSPSHDRFNSLIDALTEYEDKNFPFD